MPDYYTLFGKRTHNETTAFRLGRKASSAVIVGGSAAVPLPTSGGSAGRRQGRAGSEGQRTALISAFFSSDQQAVRLTRRPGATRSRPDEPERGCRLAGEGRRSWRGRASVSDGIAWESRNGAPAEKGSPRRPKPPHPSSVSPTSVGSDGRRQGRAGSEGQRTALISAFFSSDQQAVRLTRRPGATRSRPDEPERR